MNTERLTKDVRRVLEAPFWIQDVATETIYERVQDDHDGTFVGRIRVYFDRQGDCWFSTDKHPPMRFREPFGGGGMSPRTRNALMILALAIKLDNEHKPQREPTKV